MKNELRYVATFVVLFWLQMQSLLTSDSNCRCEAVARKVRSATPAFPKYIEAMICWLVQ